LNGVHQFENQRYIDELGNSSSYLSSYLGKGLCEFICYYSNRLSYRELSGLMERMVGKTPYKSRNLQNIVVRESQAIADYNHQENRGIQLSLNFVSPVDIYDIKTKEVLYLDDGVGVKRQKEHRCKEGDSGSKSASTVQTDVILVQNINNEYEYLTSAESSLCDLTLEDKINITLSKNYGNKAIPLVAITDGAQCIRCRLRRLFGKDIMIILDWYHLTEKIRQYTSRLGLSKSVKESHITEMLRYLWNGQAISALIYSDVMIETKNVIILEELQQYIIKHQDEICNYGYRKAIGKVIGSGKGEKANDQLVAHRQKKKGQSWSQKGSGALTVLKTLEINNQWNKYWQKAA
jgi:hypothetical protein